MTKEECICVFGDSITNGYNDFENLGWCELLKNKYLSFENNIFNLGISGDNTEDLLKRFKVECEAREPTKIIFAIGINDSQYVLNKNNSRVDLIDFEFNLNRLILQSKCFTGDIIFVGLTKVDEKKVMPIPWNETKFYENEIIQKYDKVIEKVATENSLKYIPMFDLLNEGDLDDGLHPNTKGHKKMFEKINEELEL